MAAKKKPAKSAKKAPSKRPTARKAPKAKTKAKAPAKAKPARRKVVTVTRAKPRKAPKVKAAVKKKPAAKKPTAKKATQKRSVKPAAKQKSKPAKRPAKKPAAKVLPPSKALPPNLESLFREIQEIKEGKRDIGDIPSLANIVDQYVPKQKSRIEKQKQAEPEPEPEPEPKPRAPSVIERAKGDEMGDYLANEGWEIFNHADGFDAQEDFATTDDANGGIPAVQGVLPGLFWRATLYVKGDDDSLQEQYDAAGLEYNPGEYDGGGGGGGGEGTISKAVTTGWHSNPAVLQETIDTVAENMQSLGWSVTNVSVQAYYRDSGERPVNK